MVSATLPKSADTDKTTLSTDGKVCWESDDRITVNGTGLGISAVLSDTLALFEGEVGDITTTYGSGYWATYPASLNATGYNASSVNVTLPATQTCKGDTIPNYMAAFNTAADSNKLDLQFKNLCCMIKIPVKAATGKTGDGAKLSKIEIISDCNICGEAKINKSAGGNLSMSMTSSSLSSRKMIVDCVNKFLSSSVADTFYVMLPPVSNSLLFFRFYDATGKCMQEKLTVAGTGTARNTIYRMPTVTLDAKIPVGALPEKFSVSGTQKVYFSQGNLQYIGSGSVAGESATPPYWRFATNQWDCIGNGTSSGTGPGNVTYITGATAYNNSDKSAACRDLFGYGTSGYNSKNPWMTSTTAGDYPSSSLGANTDWGRKNPIYNGGNTAGMWRTLTNDQWTYLFDTRSDTYRFSAARVHGKNGIVIFPDGFNYSGVSFGQKNNKTANPGSTVISDQNWLTLECLGCLFLPCSYYRDGTTITSNDGDKKYTTNYWTATAGIYVTTYYVSGYNIVLGASDGARSIGMCVRLATYAN